MMTCDEDSGDNDDDDDDDDLKTMMRWVERLGTDAFSKRNFPQLYASSSDLANSFVHAVKNVPTRKPSIDVSQAHPVLRPIILSCLVMDPKKRPTMREIVSRLSMTPFPKRIERKKCSTDQTFQRIYQSMSSDLHLDRRVTQMSAELLQSWTDLQAVDIFLSYWLTAALFNSYSLQSMDDTIGPMARRMGVPLSSTDINKDALQKRWNAASPSLYTAWFKCVG
jgi:serine/threonine protein kinase